MNRTYKSLPLLTLALFLFAASLPAAPDAASTQTPTQPPPVATHPVTQTPAEHAEAIEQRWYLSGLIVLLLAAGAVYKWKFKRQSA